MYPTNHYMDPYSSYYRHNAPYPYYPPPGWEAGRQRMPEVDSSCRPPYGPWPYSGSTNQSGLPESHSCCSHTYPPGYYSFRPPFPQELPPPPLYYHGPFPPHHPHPYSSSYFGPLPPYPVDQTPYGYDKFKSHCCGCPNHVCHGGQKSNLKIAEHMPEVKDESNQKVADNSSILRNPNYQYPVMWLPSGDMKDNANGTSFEFSPELFSKWFPQSGERTEDVKPADDNQKAKQLQWPIVCMPPGYNETKQQAKKELKEIEQSPKNTQEDPPSPKIKIIPLSWFENDSHDQKPAARDGYGEQSGRSSVANPTAGTEHRHDKTVDGNCKTISVVPEKPNTGNGPAISVVPEKPNSGNEPAISVVPEKQDVEKKVRICRAIPVMAQKESDEKKSYMDGNKEEKKPIIVQKEGENRKNNNVESSKAKVSKLPPVCLRVDPLPKKKSGNTSSRSSNPAARKACEKDKDMKEAQAKNQEPKLSEQQKEGNMPVKEKSSDEIGKNIGSRNITVQDASTKHAQEEQVSTSIPGQKVQPIISAEAQENFSARSLHECDKNRKEDEMKIQREAPNLAREINLSEPDAAVRIQSAYRGHLVRRCKPLEKLRKIKNVHKQMQDVEKKLQALEASSEQPTEKEHIAINETIMDLLLNLDNIQNLHPVVREARKSVARQLVCLQEMLDSLCKKLPAEANHSKSEEVSLAGVDEEQLPSSVNSKEPMHDNVSSEVSLKFSEDGDSTEQKHQMEESSTAKEEAEDEGEATSPTECPGVPLMDVMHGAALSGLITEKQQIEEPDFLREECTEEEKAPVKGEGSSTDYMEPLHYTTLSEGSALKQCTPSAEQNCHTEESGQGVSRATTEDGTTAIATAFTDSEAAVGNDCSAEGGRVQESASVGSSCLKHDAAPAEDQCKESSAPSLHLEDSSVSSKVATTFMDSEVAADGDGSAEEGGQVQEYASVGGLSLKHDAAPAEDQCKEPSVPSLHLEDSSVPSQVADSHGNDPALADDSIVITPGDQQEGLVEKKAADTMLDSGEEADGTPTPAVGDTGNMDDVTAANAENSTQEKIALVGSEATKECEVSPMDDSALAEQQNEGGSGIVGETEAVPLENEGKTMEDTQNGVIGEELEAVPLESRARTMESTLNENTLNDAGSLPRNTSAEPAPPESAGDGAPSEHDGAVVYRNPGSKVSPESQDDDDGGKVSASEATEGNASVPAETPVCATRADPAVLEAEKLKEGVPPEQEAAGAASATQDDLKSDHDDKNKNKGLADENQKLKEMLQKLLASGNDQMGVIEELSDKVKSLERKLARKRRPKVRVQHRPARNATTNNVH